MVCSELRRNDKEFIVLCNNPKNCPKNRLKGYISPNCWRTRYPPLLKDSGGQDDGI